MTLVLLLLEAGFSFRAAIEGSTAQCCSQSMAGRSNEVNTAVETAAAGTAAGLGEDILQAVAGGAQPVASLPSSSRVNEVRQ